MCVLIPTTKSTTLPSKNECLPACLLVYLSVWLVTVANANIKQYVWKLNIKDFRLLQMFVKWRTHTQSLLHSLIHLFTCFCVVQDFVDKIASSHIPYNVLSALCRTTRYRSLRTTWFKNMPYCSKLQPPIRWNWPFNANNGQFSTEFFSSRLHSSKRQANCKWSETFWPHCWFLIVILKRWHYWRAHNGRSATIHLAEQ